MDEKAKRAEEALQDKIRRYEGLPGPLTVKPFWNWQSCMHSDYCERKKDEKIKECLYNPKMFECSAYQKYEEMFKCSAYRKYKELEYKNLERGGERVDVSKHDYDC